MPEKTFLYISLLFAFICSLFCVQSFAADDSAYGKGLHFFYSGDYPQALTHFQQEKTEHVNDPRSYMFEGLCHLRMGDEAQANLLFQQGAARTFTPQGRLVNLDRALSRIQGRERIIIENVRKMMQLAWERNEEERQIKQYGEVLGTEQQRISKENDAASISFANDDSNETSSPEEKLDLPNVPPISPFSREELETGAVPDIEDKERSEYKFFRDELGKTSLSSAERKRLEAREKIVVYDNPMDKPAADGSKFVNIYDPSEIYVDSKPYDGQDDPDHIYQAAENSPLSSVSKLLKVKSGLVTVPSLPGEAAAPAPSGYGGRNDTAKLFEDSDPSNPYSSSEVPKIEREKSLDIFKSEREANLTPAAPEGEGGPGMPPGGPPM